MNAKDKLVELENRIARLENRDSKKSRDFSKNDQYREVKAKLDEWFIYSESARMTATELNQALAVENIDVNPVTMGKLLKSIYGTNVIDRSNNKKFYRLKNRYDE